jgi:hypothetical protein
MKSKILNTFINMNNQTIPIDQVMYQGASIEVTLSSGESITGKFNGFLPTKDNTFIVVVHSDLRFTNNTMIPMNTVAYINFPQKLSSLIN